MCSVPVSALPQLEPWLHTQQTERAGEKIWAASTSGAGMMCMLDHLLSTANTRALK